MKVYSFGGRGGEGEVKKFTGPGEKEKHKRGETRQSAWQVMPGDEGKGERYGAGGKRYWKGGKHETFVGNAFVVKGGGNIKTFGTRFIELGKMRLERERKASFSLWEIVLEGKGKRTVGSLVILRKEGASERLGIKPSTSNQNGRRRE